MIIGDLGSVVVAQALNMTVGAQNEVGHELRVNSVVSELGSDTCIGDVYLNVLNLVSAESLGSIRPFDSDLHPIDRFLLVLLSLRKCADETDVADRLVFVLPDE